MAEEVLPEQMPLNYPHHIGIVGHYIELDIEVAVDSLVP